MPSGSGHLRHSEAKFGLAIAAWWLVALAACIAVAVSGGCSWTANVTTTRISRRPDGTIVVDSGKDVTIGSLVYELPDGERLEVHDYSSNLNAAAIAAQQSREEAQINGAIDAVSKGVELGIGAAAKGLGVP